MKKRSFLLTAVAILGLTTTTMAQNITNFASIWYNTFSANSGGFGRAIIDNNDLVISGATWPSWPSGTTDQMVTKISPSGNIIFQTVRAPGGDHDGYQAVVKLQNGNYGFFGQQNAQGTQYFDGFYTEFNSLGIEVSYNFFSIPGSSSGSDMLMLPNGNRLYTGNHGGGLNYIALTDSNFNQLSYQTFNVGGWNAAQLGIDAINNFVYAIGSESSTSSIQIVKYDMSLNYLSTYNITHTEPLLNYDIKMDGSDILLCGYKVIGGQRFGAFYRMNTNGVITDSLVSLNTSEFTAIEKYGNEIILAKSNLSGTNSISNELNIYQGSGSFGVSHSLNSSFPFVPFDLVLNGDTLYAVGAQGSGYWIGIPAVEKVLIDACQLFPLSGTDVQTACDTYDWIDGNTYTASNNTAQWSLTNAAGCDSLVTLDLTVNYSNTGTDIQTACDTYDWIDGNTYTQSTNTPTFVLTNAQGCDSTVTLDLTITQPTQPTTACYETATFNTSTCQWDVIGTQPTQPTTACYETATFNTSTCQWDVTGTQPTQPTTACYETATFNTSTCQWDVTGSQPTQPTTACYETVTFNTSTCQWDVTGTPASISQPTNQTINVNNNAQFDVGSSAPSATYQWQTDLGVGFQNLNSVGQYSGTTTNTLTVLNVTMSNNNQPFRCIVNSGSCSDTSNVAVLTVNNNVGINEISQDNLFTVFPNPAQSVINVKADSKLIGEIYSIYDNSGRIVLTGKINSKDTTIELGNLSGGIYMLSVGENMKQTFKVIKE